jgi:hypothetical protein
LAQNNFTDVILEVIENHVKMRSLERYVLQPTLGLFTGEDICIGGTWRAGRGSDLLWNQPEYARLHIFEPVRISK